MIPDVPPDVIRLDDVSRAFPTEPPVLALSRICLRVGQGDYVAIVGPSGSGKSTLLNTLGLLDRPTSGSYLLDGIETTTLRDGARTRLRGRKIGFVYQSFHLLAHRTVVENVMLAEVYGRSGRAWREKAGPGRPTLGRPTLGRAGRGRPGNEPAGRGKPENGPAGAAANEYGRRGRRARAEEALEKVGMTHRLDFLPDRLSGGERQRVAIARALMGGPSLLLCDEPTGNLDSRNTGAVLDLFDGLRDQGLTLLVITHEDAVSSRAGRRVRISDGILTEE
ncbi:ABC transporter ATP-binding protein [Streptosporangium roseum]|uniref:ABC transporter related protein n=1 Tax=Streptosporangium roseum (strain ATCC 12428 / DSM 43021 / JCM 3005 / KCTC 9067 / NCIMB 10171 / NRRL 2505 / NI 9100) TaxID=479432 RepID=D2B2G9_STRRD|nr:ABC transporter ATP-binding protein [Streptosporangium roseum]ACZ91195.1 ABC transporter related protein [Streptosporangium roseum DSM 43021]